MDQNRLILVVEDDKDDFLILKDAILMCTQAIPIERVKNGEDLMTYLNTKPAPSLILLDLNLPKIDGREALKMIREDSRFAHVPVIVMTNSSSQEDVLYCYKMGCNTFVRKPSGFVDLVTILEKIIAYWFEAAKLPGTRPA